MHYLVLCEEKSEEFLKYTEFYSGSEIFLWQFHPQIQQLQFKSSLGWVIDIQSNSYHDSILIVGDEEEQRPDHECISAAQRFTFSLFHFTASFHRDKVKIFPIEAMSGIFNKIIVLVSNMAEEGSWSPTAFYYFMAGDSSHSTYKVFYIAVSST